MRARERRGENIVHLIIEKKRGEWKRKCSEYKNGKIRKKTKKGREQSKIGRVAPGRCEGCVDGAATPASGRGQAGTRLRGMAFVGVK